MQLSDEVINLMESNGYGDYISMHQTTVTNYNSSHIDVITEDYEAYNFHGHNTVLLLQTNLYRSRMLFNSYIDGLNNKNPYSCSLASRAYHEVTGVLSFLLKKYNRYREQDLSQEEFSNVIKSLLLGIKLKDGFPADVPKPINAMTLIDSVDDFSKKYLDSKEKTFRNNYDNLSEICHPNSYGNLLAANVKGTEYHFRGDKETLEIFTYSIAGFYSACSLYFILYFILKDTLKQHEKIPFNDFKY